MTETAGKQESISRLYNYLVIAAMLLTVVFWALPEVNEYWLNDSALDLLEWNGWGSFLPSGPLLYWSLPVFWIVVSLGLLMRSRFSRSAYAAGVIVFTLAGFGWGFVILTPEEVGVGGILTMLHGAILALSYLSGVADEFK